MKVSPPVALATGGQECDVSNENLMTRRRLFMKLGILFNGVVAAALAVPIVRYLSASATRAHRTVPWVALGSLKEFPEGETRLATFRNPIVTPTDGQTADTACWVRRIEGQQFQVFAVNCAHLGCPVRWFPQAGLFMCPCHGGAYYRDGSRASGPPERGLFEYPFKVENGVLTIQAGELPTPGTSAPPSANSAQGTPATFFKGPAAALTAATKGQRPPCA